MDITRHRGREDAPADTHAGLARDDDQGAVVGPVEDGDEGAAGIVATGVVAAGVVETAGVVEGVVETAGVSAGVVWAAGVVSVPVVAAGSEPASAVAVPGVGFGFGTRFGPILMISGLDR